jgi:DNA-binding MarR family transcriptional regulator
MLSLAMLTILLNVPTKTLPATTTLELADALRPAVLRLARRLRQTRDESVELTASQYSVLAALSIRGRLSMGELAAEERVRPPTVTRVVNALVDRDLVRRMPAPHDGRQSLVDLTDAGRALLLANQRLRAEWLADRLAELDAAELDLLRTAVPLLVRVAAG